MQPSKEVLEKIDLGHYGYACPTCNEEMNSQEATCQNCGQITVSTRVKANVLLKRHMVENDYSQRKLAELMGLAHGHLSNIISGHTAVTRRTALKLVDVFPGTDLHYWIGKD